MATDESDEHALPAALERLLVSADQIRRLADDLPFGIAIWRAESADPGDLRLVYANTEASRQSGMELGPLVGKTAREVLPAALLAPDVKKATGPAPSPHTKDDRILRALKEAEYRNISLGVLRRTRELLKLHRPELSAREVAAGSAILTQRQLGLSEDADRKEGVVVDGDLLGARGHSGGGH